MNKNTLPPHIPSNAEDVTSIVRALGINRSNWYVSNGKVYSSNPVSLWNNTDWESFRTADFS